MAEIVGRILVENGQERILHRIYDGVTSNLILDVADSKQSQEHQLIHLVWRRFPRNRTVMEGPKTTCPISTQTEVDFNMGLYKISKNSITSVTNCSSTAGKDLSDQREFIDTDNSASSSDSGSPECYNSTGQSKKRRDPEKIDQIQLSNRFDCLENEECPEIPNKFSSKDRDSTVTVRRGRRRGPPKTFKTKTNSTKSKISPKPDLSSANGTVEHKFSPENRSHNVPKAFGSVPPGISDEGVNGKTLSTKVPSSSRSTCIVPSVPSVPSRRPKYENGTIKFFNSYPYQLSGVERNCGCISVDGSNIDVPFRSDRFKFKPGRRATFDLEFNTQGKQQAINVYPLNDALSPPRDPNDSDYY